MRDRRCQLEDLILGILAVVVDWGMDRGLREWVKEKGWEEEGWEEEEMGMEGMKGLIGYLGKKKEWKGLKVFQMIKKIWWILKKKWIKEIKKST